MIPIQLSTQYIVTLFSEKKKMAASKSPSKVAVEEVEEIAPDFPGRPLFFVNFSHFKLSCSIS